MSEFEQFQKLAVCSLDNNSSRTSAPFSEAKPREALLDGPQLARKIFCLGIPQLVCGFLMTCGMILYLGIILGEQDSIDEVFVRRYVMVALNVSEIDLSYTVSAIITATLVSHIVFE